MEKLNKAFTVTSREHTPHEPDEELRALDAAIARSPCDAALRNQKGLALSARGLYREAGECHARAAALDPFNGEAHLHRGHRMLSQWRFEDARADLALAARLIPDTWGVWYHLGLACFLLCDYEAAAAAFDRCIALSESEANLVAVCDWQYMTEQRRGRPEAAAAVLDRIGVNFDPGDNTAYFSRLLMYKGLLRPEEVLPEDLASLPPLEIITMGFGLSNAYFIAGDMEKSNEIIDLVLRVGDENDCFFAFGYLAAMVDREQRAAARAL